MTLIPLTTTPISEIEPGELLLDYDGHGDDAGEAGTYDEAGLADLVERLRDRMPLPAGWTLRTQSEYDGCVLICYERETGRIIDSASTYRDLVETIAGGE